MSARLKAALEGRSEARRIADEEVRRMLLADYAVGKPVTWVKGSPNIQCGNVLRHFGDADTLLVRNARTLREVRIHAYDIVQAMETRR